MLHYPYDMEVNDQGDVWLFGFASDTVGPTMGIVAKFSDHGQTFDWAHDYPDHSLRADLDIDQAGNAYIGTTVYDTIGDTRSNYLTRKIAPDGTVLWSRTWTGNGNNSLDRASALCVDGGGNVIITGFCEGAAFSGFRWMTVKYSSAGDLLWETEHVPPTMWNGTEGGIDITTDAADNIYVTGSSHDELNGDFATIKYAPDGTEVWLRREGGFVYSQGNCVQVRGDRVFVAGHYTYDDLDSSDAFVACYDTAGVTLWTTTYDAPHPVIATPVNGREVVSDLVIDDGGNVLFAGTQFSTNGASNDYLIVKLDLNGDTLWQRHYDAGTSWGDARSMFCDGSGNVFVTGMCENTPTGYMEIHTVKYDATGVLQWYAPYTPSFWDFCHEGLVRWDGADHFYVGSSSNGWPPVNNKLLLLGYSITVDVHSVEPTVTTSLYPNPSSGQICVDLTTWTGPVAYILLDVFGRTVQQGQWNGGGTSTLEVGNEAASAYMLVLNASSRRERMNLVIER